MELIAYISCFDSQTGSQSEKVDSQTKNTTKY